MSNGGKSRFAILGMLATGPMSGYDIKKATEASTRHFWNESFGNLYPTLGRLEREGLVTGDLQPQSGKPDRKVYSITDAGRDALAAWLREPVDAQPPRNELLLKLFFGQQVPNEVSREHVEQFRDVVRSRLATYEGIRVWLEREHGSDDGLPFWLMTLSYGQHVTKAQLEWSDESLRLLGPAVETKEHE